ncbi:uncharacterized protein KD926_002125 [Aspergillus affinis]|uniref:uncharacterized protein n=1 Tax=Aspergillus affinis TaxID=1070780 RepID=UPI0022FE5893|nr:uncharacterized protein KD926_002125 [Aspergillus affinis]KAI9036260.1 hypothetical protein KD926_002125 [Aspergillus affinis]
MRPQNVTESNHRRFQLDLQDYKDSRNNIAKVEEAIRSSIAIHVQPLVERKRRFEILKALKQQYEPTTEELEDKALKQYEAVIKRSPRRGKINAWIQEFEHAYLAIKRLDMPEGQDHYIQREFLSSIEAVDTVYASQHYSRVRKTSFIDLLSDFRSHLANSGRDDPTASGHLYATLNGQSDSTPNPQESQDSRKRELLLCQCGERHRYRDCHYLYPNTRPKDWKPDEKIVKNIKDFAARSGPQSQRIKSIIEKNWKEAEE